MTSFFAERTDCAQYLGAVVLIVPFGIQRAFAFRTRVLRAFEASSVSVIGAAACLASVVASDIVPRRGHVPGNVRTLRR